MVWFINAYLSPDTEYTIHLKLYFFPAELQHGSPKRQESGTANRRNSMIKLSLRKSLLIEKSIGSSHAKYTLSPIPYKKIR